MKGIIIAMGLLLAVPLITLLSTPATSLAATSPDEILEDPALELRARSLGKELRCLVCQNQSIDDSDAPLARDLRLIVRERLVDGDSDQDIRDYLVARYGDFVLLKPPINLGTLALWGGPFLILLLGMMVIAKFLKSRPKVLEEPIIAEHEASKAATILGQDSRN